MQTAICNNDLVFNVKNVDIHVSKYLIQIYIFIKKT